MIFQTKKPYKKKEQIENALKEKTNINQNDILSIKKSLLYPPIKTDLIHNIFSPMNTLIEYNNYEENTNIILTNEISHKYNNTQTLYIPPKPKNQSIIENIIFQKGIHTLINIYQPVYKNNERSSGLGDFIRGSYFLMLFCEKYNLHCKISFHNGIENLLHNKLEYNPPIKIFSEIPIFQNNNIIHLPISINNIILTPITNPNILHLFSEYLLSIPLFENKGLLYCTCSPFSQLQKHHKLEMQRVLEPTTEIYHIITNTLSCLSLIKKNYICIHIRCGDDYLNNNSNRLLKKTFIQNIFENIKIIYSKNENYLLLSDNQYIKKIIITYFPYIKTIFNDITHLSTIHTGEEKEKIKNTMLEFYLLSFSKKIISYSCYQHGSGFSYWCAMTYNIPYICKYISNEIRK